ncbi:MAG: tetraacyldisaccharide 4'-kinase [Gemmataceae bacterium]|nr:tetraacyldisaccharide 4'-kinase [Gemmataceae bacterium]
MPPRRGETVPAAAANPSPRERFLKLVKGETRGVLPSLARFGLWLLSLGYGLAVRLRNAAYSWGWLRVERAPVPVISVGNLTAGGTGKTPFVEWVCRLLREDRLVAILSRGYGAHDEALVLEENLPDVPHFQGPDRAALARAAVEECESQALVLDDGFQHRRLHRDLDLVLIDATDPWGGGHLLPRGLLREPVSGLRRAHAVVLTRTDQVETHRLADLRKALARWGKPVAEAVHRPSSLVGVSGGSPLSDLAGRSVAGFCGLGNPEAFRRTLEGLGTMIADFRAYPDHHPYTREDVDDLGRWARAQPEGAWLVTTQKDLVKLRVESLGGRQLRAVRIEMEIRSGREELEALVRAACQGGRP